MTRSTGSAPGEPTLYAYTEEGIDPHEVQLRLNAADENAFRRLPRGDDDGPWVTVFDELTGTFFDVRPATCGADCYCAAEARPSQRST